MKIKYKYFYFFTLIFILIGCERVSEDAKNAGFKSDEEFNLHLQSLKDERDRKLNICNNCDKYNKSMKICSICKCVMPLKVFIKGDTCPINKHEVV